MELRLQLLEQSGQASHEVIAEVRDIIAEIEQRYGLRLDNESGGMFVNHIALALERLRLGRGIESVPPVVVQEARSLEREWEFAAEIASRVGERLGRPAPEAEVAYIAVYIGAVVRSRGPRSGGRPLHDRVQTMVRE